MGFREDLVKKVPLRTGLEKFLFSVASAGPSKLSIQSTPDGILEVTADGATGTPSLLDPNWTLKTQGSLLRASLIYLLTTSKEAEITVGNFKQRFADGVAQEIEQSWCHTGYFHLTLKPDVALLKQSLDCFPFKSKMQELAAFNPELVIECRYMGFPPMTYESKNGMMDLVEMMHSDPPVQQLSSVNSWNMDAVVGFAETEMEKMKIFQDGVEVFNHPLEEVIRERLRAMGLKSRKQAADHIKTGRESYFGVYTTIPNREEEESEQILTIPGLILALSFTGNLDQRQIQLLEDAAVAQAAKLHGNLVKEEESRWV